ncbi:MAG: RT0821/Lpp0805 family surface protein [Alphaproteobacteria bacterium]
MIRLVLSTAVGWLVLAALPGPAAAAEDFRDVAYLADFVNRVLENERTGDDVAWSNPETGNGGIITIERTYFLDPESPCRDYRRTTEQAGGAQLVMTGTGCRTPAGVWRLDEQVAPPPPAPAPPATPAAATSPPASTAPVGPGEPASDSIATVEPVAAAPPLPAEPPRFPLPQVKPNPVIVYASVPSQSAY